MKRTLTSTLNMRYWAERKGFWERPATGRFAIRRRKRCSSRPFERLARKERVKSDANLQTALDSVAGSRLYVAGANLKDLRMMPFPIDRFWGCVSVASSVRIEVTMVFADANQAMTCKQMIDGLSGMSAMMPPDKKILDPIFSALKTRQNGNELHCEATWQNADFLAFLKMAKESRGMFPVAPSRLVRPLVRRPALSARRLSARSARRPTTRP